MLWNNKSIGYNLTLSMKEFLICFIVMFVINMLILYFPPSDLTRDGLVMIILITFPLEVIFIWVALQLWKAQTPVGMMYQISQQRKYNEKFE